MTLKVLKLESWMKYRTIHSTEPLDPCKPIYNRDGMYYNSLIHHCWFETNGEAYRLEIGDFKSALEILNFKPLLNRERDAIIVLHRSRLASEHQLKLLEHDNHQRELRHNKLMSFKFRKQFRNNWKNHGSNTRN